MKKNKIPVSFYGVLAAAALLCACAPVDDIDYEIFGPEGFVERKFVYFDLLSRVKETNSDEKIDAGIYDYQRGGPEGPTYGLSPNHDHTAELIGGAPGIKGKSFRWGNKTNISQRIKFDSMFTPADIGMEFYISLWVYSAAPAAVRVGAFSLSGRLKVTRWEVTPRECSQTIYIESGWNEVVWAGYVHEDLEVTQLGFEQVGGSVVDEFYIDDIILWAR
jgi:hypothetical protein